MRLPCLALAATLAALGFERPAVALDGSDPAGPTSSTVASASLAEVPLKYPGLAPERGPREVVDVLLAELYDLAPHARVGTYPDGLNGLSATTTSCNNGTVDVPWQAPMSPAHPFIGIAMLREVDGALEMIGRSWLKHGFFAAAWNHPNFCGGVCPGSGGSKLRVGCSDTYSAMNNAAQLYLGPREEVNPHTGAWEPCGSFFDGMPSDCIRSYQGLEPDAVAHTLEVHDSDLGRPGARYFYEACYYVAGDDVVDNNVGWRECSTAWTGSSWAIETTGPWYETVPNPGPVVLEWGDDHDTRAVAPGDGLAILASRVTDLGGGQWHYEYALYNRSSHRGLRSFSIPVGGAKVTNAGFRDIDRDPDTDWTAAVDGGSVTWSTAEWASDPDAPALFYQTLFNFRFDADRSPAPATATAGLFRPGPGTAVLFDAPAPTPAADTPQARAEPARLLALERNPFSRASLRCELPRRGRVRVSVHDVTGRTVQLLLDGEAPAGVTPVAWDGRDSSGRPAANGVYFFRLESQRATRVVKGVLLR